MVASLVNLQNAAQASTYYERDNYYSHGQGPSQWWGKAAEKLGLEGAVDRDAFDDLLHGKMPDGTELPAGHKGKRLPGYDMTFSAPKSVSLMAMIGDDDRLVEAHRKAISTALDWLQETSSMARTTENDRTRTEGTGNLLVARFDHDTSRELDPQLHTHSVILNATQREDGQWRAVANNKIYDNKMASGAIYRAELAGHLRGLGYEIEVTHSDGRFEIAGFSREQIDHFSHVCCDVAWHDGIRIVTPTVAIRQALETGVPTHLVRQSIDRARRLGLAPRSVLSQLAERLTVGS